MKKAILLLLIAAAAVYFWRAREKAMEAKNPPVISNPVYAEVRIAIEGNGRSIEGVALAKTVDRAECEQFAKPFADKLAGGQAGSNGVSLKLQSSECKTDLAPRNARLFDDEPAFVTYVRVARGDPKEREVRLIWWGLSVEESDKVCNLFAPQVQKGWKGAVTCIKARRS
jgi:hypothetical protein